MKVTMSKLKKFKLTNVALWVLTTSASVHAQELVSSATDTELPSAANVSMSNHNVPSTVSTPSMSGADSKVAPSSTTSVPAANNDVQKDVSFNPVFLHVKSVGKTDLTRFEKGAFALPGTYPSDIYINDLSVGNYPVMFKLQPDKSVQLCLAPDTIKHFSLKYDALPVGFADAMKAGENGCVFVKQALPQVTASYDSGAQRLDLSIPQAQLMSDARGYVSPEMWDKGVSAAFMGYTVNGYSSRNNGQTTNSAFGNFNGGINLGGWYFRHNGSYNWQQNGEKQYQTINTYAQHDIAAIGGRILLGENNTSGQVFDTLPYRGAELVDDERMRPQSQRGYAPDIRGMARTNARVTIRQNGVVLYDTTVAPGPFDINDLYPTGYGGDLNVTVTEADGTTQTFNVPFGSISQLLRPGAQHYDFVVGKLNDDSVSDNPALYQATYQRGLTNLFTGYGGMQGSEHYYAGQLGVAINTPIGAVAIDATQSSADIDAANGSKMTGQSYRVSYNKYLPETDSNLSLAAYRFNSKNYLDFRTASQMRENNTDGDDSDNDNVWRPKNKFSVTANQGLADNWGQLYVSGYVQNYWNEDSSDVQYQGGYSNTWGVVSYSVTAGRTRNSDGDMETTYMLNLSMPLGTSSMTSTAPQLTSSITKDASGSVGEQVGISGTAGNDGQYSYGVTGSHYDQGTGSSGTINGQYRSPYTNLTGSYGDGKNYQNTSLGLSGTIIAYQDGIVLSPYTSDTFAIVEAKGAAGAKVGSYAGLKLDHWGHAAVPYLNPYELNDITVDPKGTSYGVDMENTSQKTAPNSGAIVLIKFKTDTGYPLLITSTLSSGEPVPFGAEVLDSAGNSIGAVGQFGQIFARVSLDKDTLTAKWGDKASQQCQVTYILPPQATSSKSSAITRFNSVCGAVGLRKS